MYVMHGRKPYDDDDANNIIDYNKIIRNGRDHFVKKSIFAHWERFFSIQFFCLFNLLIWFSCCSHFGNFSTYSRAPLLFFTFYIQLCLKQCLGNGTVPTPEVHTAEKNFYSKIENNFNLSCTMYTRWEKGSKKD